MIKILIIEDDELLGQTLTLELGDLGHETRVSTRIKDGTIIAKDWHPDLILLDIHLPDQDNLQTLPQLCEAFPATFIVVMTGDPDNNIVMEAMQAGAFDFLRKPLDLDELQTLVSKVSYCAEYQKAMGATKTIASKNRKASLREIIGAAPSIIKLLKNIGMLARTRIPVLIEGESGTGKELVARILHNKSCPAEPFVAINCSAIVPTLLESELFGHEKGAFTGADRTKIGKMQFAGQGTVFLDEIGDLPLELQSKLLRVLQEEEFVRVGGLQTIPLKARIIAATNQNLKSLLDKKKFREDLYYRLAVSKLGIPTLRERQEDIPMLVNHCLTRISQRLNTQSITIDPAALSRLKKYSWPGNIRELENILTSAIALANSSILTADDLKLPEIDAPAVTIPKLMPLAEVEIRHIKDSLQANSWHITNTASQLGISQTTLRKKISEHNLRPSRRQSDLQS